MTKMQKVRWLTLVFAILVSYQNCAPAGLLPSTNSSSGNSDGSGPLTNAATKPQRITTSYIDPSTNSGHTCAIKKDGGLLCWGQNWNGQFGNGSSMNFSLFPTAGGLPLTDIVALTTGWFHMCGLRSNGLVACWGLSTVDGGSGGLLFRTAPVTMPGLSGVKALSSGGYYNCAITTAGKAYCWGTTPLGAFATATEVTSVTNVTSVATGGSFTCVVHTDTTASCWGSNNLGQLGNGATATYLSGPTPTIGPAGGAPNSSITPNKVQIHSTTTTKSDLSGIVSLYAGLSHVCALMNDATVKCWGDNNGGALGTTANSLFPSFTVHTSAAEVVGLSNVVQLVAGARFNCALLKNSTVKCWGDNAHGQLGDGTKTQRKTPVQVLGLEQAVSISAGEAHACALLSSGDIKCWGTNGMNGSLGNNSTAESLTPVSTAAGAVF